MGDNFNIITKCKRRATSSNECCLVDISAISGKGGGDGKQIKVGDNFTLWLGST